MAIECNHGRLARKCELCELEEALARISALEAENAKLVELLRSGLPCGSYMGDDNYCGTYNYTCDHCKAVESFLVSIGVEGK